MCRDRNRLFYGIFIIFVMFLGLGSRRFSAFLPHWLANYSGDTLWALMIFLGVGFLFKTRSTVWVAVSALGFSFLIEFSQLYHSPWIDEIRSTRTGGLILGFGFLWSDLICYTVGIGIGIYLESLTKRSLFLYSRNK